MELLVSASKLPPNRHNALQEIGKIHVRITVLQPCDLGARTWS